MAQSSASVLDGLPNAQHTPWEGKPYAVSFDETSLDDAGAALERLFNRDRDPLSPDTKLLNYMLWLTEPAGRSYWHNHDGRNGEPLAKLTFAGCKDHNCGAKGAYYLLLLQEALPLSDCREFYLFGSETYECPSLGLRLKNKLVKPTQVAFNRLLYRIRVLRRIHLLTGMADIEVIPGPETVTKQRYSLFRVKLEGDQYRVSEIEDLGQDSAHFYILGQNRGAA